MENRPTPPAGPSVGFSIGPMEAGHMEKVLGIERLSHPHPWSADLFLRELENPLSDIDLLWFGNDLAGYLCSWLVADELHILNVATAPDFRRRGVAAALLRHVIDRARGRGMQRTFLEVRAGNIGAISLYRSFGFTVVSRRLRYYGDGEDALVMEVYDPLNSEAFLTCPSTSRREKQ